MAIIRATDLSLLQDCERIVFLNNQGDPALREPASPYDELLRARGQAHEAGLVAGMQVLEAAYPPGDLPAGFRETLALMRAGAERIYQGVLMHDDLVGIPDLMLRVEGLSRFGAYAYRPVDIKLASRPDSGYQLQVMTYVYLLDQIQGLRPEGALWLRPPRADRIEGQFQHVEVPVPFDEDRFTAQLAAARRLATEPEAPRPFFSSTCSGCAWRKVCVPMVREARDPSLLPGLRRRSWEALHEAGIHTLGQVAALSLSDLLELPGVGESTARRILRAARALDSGEIEVLAPPPLPRPGGPEVFFDLESIPLDDLVYLYGMLIREGDQITWEAVLAESPAEEGKAWAEFLNLIDLIEGPIYHYGHYERSALKALAEKHGGSERVEALLPRLVDLRKVLDESVVLPLSGMSLKEVGPFIGYRRQAVMQQGEDSMAEYLGWLRDGDRGHLDRIVHYNREDCEATLAVLDWLRALPPGP